MGSCILPSTLHQTSSIALQVDLDDMEWRPSSNHAAAGKAPDAGAVASPTGMPPDSAASGGCYARSCRCGGEFWLAEGDLCEDADSMLVPCSTCSSCVRVLYSLAPA